MASAGMGINPPSPLMGGMSSIPTSQTNPAEGPEMGSNSGPKMVFRVVQALKALASAYPDVSEDVDQLVKQVEQVGMTLMSGGSQGQPNTSSMPQGMEMGGPF